MEPSGEVPSSAISQAARKLPSAGLIKEILLRGHRPRVASSRIQPAISLRLILNPTPDTCLLEQSYLATAVP
jgi:hypothetical protein